MAKSVNTRVLPGFMELLPEEQIEFDRIKAIIETEYQKFGFTALDTPAIERSETLLAKAGGETEKQIYRFTKGENDLSLRFDLTVPLARYVADHFDKLSFPFRRCHIAKVYRGESPQKGRFREFYQCDIDVIGKDELSIAYDAEIPSVIYNIFTKLNFGKFTIRVNNRKILNGLMAQLGLSEISVDVMRIIDKVEKISPEDFDWCLHDLGVTDEQIGVLRQFIGISGSNKDILAQLRQLGITEPLFLTGVDELEAVITLMGAMGIKPGYFTIDLSIARGLDYYTGTVYETKLDDYPKLGSICSGGRFDNLASYYTKEKLPGVGISIGLTRLFYQLRELNLIPCSRKTIADVIIVPLDQKAEALAVAARLRAADFRVDVLLEDCSTKKKFQYVSKKDVPVTVVIGDQEVAEKRYTVQTKLADGTIPKKQLSLTELLEKLKKLKGRA
ncbi:MAG: histidine--tRNA ligase [bacterium]|nr:histidine--tRNA ligase [bacterium]